ncbi:MAG: hypothetical protein Q9222_007816 [Ikaeria aurantiellina]
MISHQEPTLPSSKPTASQVSDEATHISSNLPICTGYLDNTLAIFRRHKHAFIMVGTQANTWSGVNSMPLDEIDLLVRSSYAEAIIKDLITSQEWETCDNPDPMYANTCGMPDTWLKSRIEDPFFHYLRLWPEELYKLSIDCSKIEVPDVMNKGCVLFEEQYYPDPHQRFGPSRASTHQRDLLPVLQIRAKFRSQDIPIYMPSIQDHLNALLSQMGLEDESGLKTGNAPRTHLRNYVRYLFFDWAPQRDWILDTVVSPVLLVTPFNERLTPTTHELREGGDTPFPEADNLRKPWDKGTAGFDEFDFDAELVDAGLVPLIPLDGSDGQCRGRHKDVGVLGFPADHPVGNGGSSANQDSVMAEVAGQ